MNCKHYDNAYAGSRFSELLVFSTGGTIAMQESAGGGVRSADDISFLSRSQLVAYKFDLPEDIVVREVVWGNLPSPHMTPELMLKLSDAVDTALEEDNVLGAVVLHGTDLLPETAFVLELTLKTRKPIVVTGSMRHLDELAYDGFRNISNALRICLEMPASSEVVVTMNDEIYAAREVVKSNSVASNSMSSEFGILGRVVEQNVLFAMPPAIVFQQPFDAAAILEAPLPEVFMLSAFSGMDGGIIDHLLQKGVKGLVVEGFGAGNVTPGLSAGIKSATQQGVYIVICTRCPNGGAHPIYSYEGGGRKLQTHGAILAGAIPAPKALLFLQMAIAARYTVSQVTKFFNLT